MASTTKAMSNGISPNESDRQATLAFMRAVKAGKTDATPPEVHDPTCKLEIAAALLAMETAKGDTAALDRAYIGCAMAEDNRGRKKYPLFAELVAEEEASAYKKPDVSEFDLSSFAQLPEEATLSETLAEGASLWLDEYIAFSRRWSPRAYDDFHEAVGLWVLSTVAARRVSLPHGGKRYTPLFIALTARTSLYSKSTTADIGLSVLAEAELEWMLAPDESTPQRFIQSLAGRLPPGYGTLTPTEQEMIRRQLALSGQRGWFYEEFGQHLAAMARENGTMADFKGIIRRLDDCKAKYSRETISRGSETIIAPYVALLVGMTPADIRAYAKAGGAMWHDGFWARWAFVTPSRDVPKDDRFPRDIRYIPPRLVIPLIEWHKRLGMPDVTITLDEEGQYHYTRGALKERMILWTDSVYEAYYRYDSALKSLLKAASFAHGDFDGNYARFPEKALRIALLFASLENAEHIEMRHWARAQQITERWRASLHHLYDQVNQKEKTEPERLEEKIMAVLEKLGEVTPGVIRQYVRGVDTSTAAHMLVSLAHAGEIEQVKGTKKFRMVKAEATV